jgi:long-chain acyl-CoA synthetase
VFPDRYEAAKPAYMMARAQTVVTYGDLTDRSRRGARLMRGLGARHGDTVAILLENHVRLLELAWAAQRAGLRYTAISPRLTVDEVAYILGDSGAKVLFASTATLEVAQAASSVRVIDVDSDYEALIASQPAEPLEDEVEGIEFLYSSGTTGRPKAIKSELPLDPIGTPPAIVPLFERLYGFGEDTVYLSPAPLYHSAPLRFNMVVHRLGGTTIVMERFDALELLELIERHRVTHIQMVPTMFVRLLRLTEEERARFDLSSLRVIVHAAAPCPVEIKARMIEWLGPIVYEYYSSTEVHLLTAIDSHEWLTHRGSVGRALLGVPHILDDDGVELAAGEPGTVWSEDGPKFEYHNDPDKTAGSRNERGWTTVGDIGYLDAEGYLYLTDRKADMIISGGVNIYPQEAENVLIEHELVADAAVFGIQHEELGEEVKAVVQLVAVDRPEDEIEAELLAFCHARLAKYKCPRTIDFALELPRHATGKLYKRVLRDQYAAAASERATPR